MDCLNWSGETSGQIPGMRDQMWVPRPRPRRLPGTRPIWARTDTRTPLRRPTALELPPPAGGGGVFALALLAASPATLLLIGRPLKGLDEWAPGRATDAPEKPAGTGKAPDKPEPPCTWARGQPLPGVPH